jgi:hypothetical protein
MKKSFADIPFRCVVPAPVVPKAGDRMTPESIPVKPVYT